MKNIFIVLILFIVNLKLNSQTTRLAILDFENISGISKYDGLGKAMSSMLISDIESNVSPKRLQLVERAQIQKVLKEQSFQASGKVNPNTAVKAGKILGVSYLLIGDIYILNDQLIINARLINTTSGDIVFSKKQEGKTLNWLLLKTNIAKDLAISLSQPFIEPTIPDKEIPVATITTFGNALAAKDTGNVQMAETLSSTVSDFNPEFKYIDDLKKEIDELKKEIEKNTADIKKLNIEVTENVTDYLELGYKYSSENNFVNAEKYFLIGFSKIDKINIVSNLEYIYALSQFYYNSGEYVKSLKYSNMGLDVYPYFKEFLYFKYMSYAKLNQFKEFNQIIKTSKEIIDIKGDQLIISYLEKYAENNNIQYIDIEEFIEWKQNNKILIKAIRYNGEFYFNPNYDISFNEIAIECISEVYNENPKQAALLLNQLDLSKSSSRIVSSVAWYTMLAGDFIDAQEQFYKIILNTFERISDCANYGNSIPSTVDCIKSNGCINWGTIPDENKMSVINWGHSYLLSGDINNALNIYQLFPADFKFGKDFQYLKFLQVLDNDLNDFEKLGLISKDKIIKIKQLIITNKN